VYSRDTGRGNSRGGGVAVCELGRPVRQARRWTRCRRQTPAARRSRLHERVVEEIRKRESGRGKVGTTASFIPTGCLIARGRKE